jgi:hypothetical protein
MYMAVELIFRDTQCKEPSFRGVIRLATADKVHAKPAVQGVKQTERSNPECGFQLA